MRAKPLKQINGWYTEKQSDYLTEQKDKTGNSKVTILRLALVHYMKFKEGEK